MRVSTAPVRLTPQGVRWLSGVGLSVWLVLGAACKTSTPERTAAAIVPAGMPVMEQKRAAPGGISDAPLTPEECRRFGALRASDPMETESAEFYTTECIEMTSLEPPWMRKMTRCMLETAHGTEEERATCFTDEMATDEYDPRRLEELEARQRELERERDRLDRELLLLELEIERHRARKDAE